VALYAVFAVGIGNLGRQRTPRCPMTEWVKRLNRALGNGTPPLQVVGFFGHTGNFLVSCSITDPESVRACFIGQLQTDWIVRRIEDVKSAVTASATYPKPEARAGIRWTQGLAFSEDPNVECRRLQRTPRAILWEVCRGISGVCKADCLAERDILDRHRRSGGWGKISEDIGNQLGGRWTARSLRTVQGLLRKATALPKKSVQ
jgi:hypothetical protein